MSLLRNIGSFNQEILPAPPGDQVQDIAPAPIQIEPHRRNIYNVVPGMLNRGLSISGVPIDWKQLIKPALIIGGLYLISRQGKKITGESRNKSLLPLLLVGGAAAYYFYNKSKTPAPSTGGGDVVITPGDGPGGGGPAPVGPPVEVGSTVSELKGAINMAFPQYKSTVSVMTDDEVHSFWQYLFAFKMQGLPLTVSSNSDLYNKVTAISTRYNIAV